MITTRVTISCAECDNHIESDTRQRAICRATNFGWHLSVDTPSGSVDLCPVCWVDHKDPEAPLKALADELAAEADLAAAVGGWRAPS
jgi:hypothetical protein